MSIKYWTIGKDRGKSVKVAAANALAVLFYIACAGPAWAAASPNFLWQVQVRGSTIYLLGSIHVLKKEVYPLSKTIQEAFAQSDTLAVEANINDLTRIDLERIAFSSLYREGDNLERHVSPATLALIKKEAGRLALPLEVALQQKPWCLGLTLQSLALLQAGYDPAYGVDQHFLTRATGKKKILELEGLDEQIDLLAGLSETEQEIFLLSSLNDLKNIIREADKLVETWRAGAVKRLEAIIAKNAPQDNSFTSINEKLILDRNKKMAAVIETYLKSPGTCFVIVGAAHLIGNQGIVQLLKDKGYKVRQL